MPTRIFSLIVFLVSPLILQANISILNGLTHSHYGAPGDLIRGKVILFNSSAQTRQLRIEVFESKLDCSTGRDFHQRQPHASSLSPWLESGLADIVLQPGETRSFPYDIKVPNDPQLQGTYWATLMVSPADSEFQEVYKKGIGLRSQLRYAIGIMAEIGAPGPASLQVLEAQLQPVPNGSGKELSITLQNPINFAEAVQCTLRVLSLEEDILELKSKRLLVYPGACRTIRLPLNNLKPGQYKGVLIVDARGHYTGQRITFQID